MPTDQSDAIVLRSFNVGDQDKIIVLFSREKGLIKGVAKGARKFGNRFGSSLEPMSLVRVFYYEKERKDLFTISNCDLVESFFDIQKDFRAACTLAYFTEIIEEFFPLRAGEDVLFRLLLSTLRALRDGGDIDLLTRYFEAWFLRINGLLPDFSRCRKCGKKMEGEGWLSPKKDGVLCPACAPQKKDAVAPEVALFLKWARKSPPPEKGEQPFAAVVLESARKSLQGIIIYHLEKEPKSLHYLKK
jgi:DNA repair protein RecO (recombination protein O)